MAFDMSSGSSMNQNEPLRAVVSDFASSSSRKEMRLVEEVTAASNAPVCMPI